MVYGTVEHPIRQHRYHTILENLIPQESARFVCEIQESEKYVLGHLGHVLIENTGIVVGYIGDNRVDLVDSYDEALHPHHNLLIDILSKCLI